MIPELFSAQVKLASSVLLALLIVRICRSLSFGKYVILSSSLSSISLFLVQTISLILSDGVQFRVKLPPSCCNRNGGLIDIDGSV